MTNKTLQLITGGLFNAPQTWQSYLQEEHDWKQTFITLTGPVILVAVVLSTFLGWLLSSYSMFAQQSGLGFMLLRLVGAFVGILLAAFIFSYLAGIFKGKHDFNRGVAALSLTAIPAYVGTVLGSIPFIGWLIALGLGIVSLVFLYKIIPSYFNVPEEKRVVHYIASLLTTFILLVIINVVLGLGAYSSGFDGVDNHTVPASSGMFGELERQGNLFEKAENDRYKAPSDGKVTEEQVAQLILMLKKTEDYQTRQQEKMKKLDEQMKDKKSFSFSDLGKLTSGISTVVSGVNAEMEVVTTAGGNWAEHQWVKAQLQTAIIQKDLNEAVKYNYALYEKYQDELSSL